MKKIVSFLILNIGIFVLCSGQVLANDEIMITHNEFAVVTSTEMNGIIPVQEFGFTYLGGDKLALTECFPELMEDATEIIIPKSVGDYDVTQINSNAFSRCTQVKSIVVADSVETVECGAFYGCTSLEKITLPFVGKTWTDA